MSTQKFAGLRSRIDTGFEWLSIMVVPALFLASTIIGLELLPGFADLTVAHVAVGSMLAGIAQGVMLVSIESAMLGCSVVAKRAKRAENKPMYRKYMFFGIAFLLLFVITFVFQYYHVDAQIDGVLLVVRCGFGGCYGYFCHGDNHQSQELTAQQASKIDELTERINKLAETVTKLADRPQIDVDELLAKLDASNQESIKLAVQQIEKSAIFTMDETLNRVIASLPGGQQTSDEDAEGGQGEGHQFDEGDRGRDTENGQGDTEMDMSLLEGQGMDTQGDTSNGARIQAYRALHPEATRKEIAEALGISIKTVQRYRSGQGDMPGGQQASGENAEGGHQATDEDTESGQQASEMDEPIDIRRKKIRVVR